MAKSQSNTLPSAIIQSSSPRNPWLAARESSIAEWACPLAAGHADGSGVADALPPRQRSSGQVGAPAAL
eukprot:156759-Alexandrium_andersonii.AAC.1